jgi:signal peptidase II
MKLQKLRNNLNIIPMKVNRIAKIIIGLVLVISNVSCDQITKNSVRKNIDSSERIEVVNDNFILTKVENTGVALGFGADFHPNVKLIIFQLLPIVVLLYMFFYLMKKEEISAFNFIAITFIIGGGIGNIMDRMLFNSVTDFMYLEIGPFHTGIFNMADVSVTIGAIGIIVNSFKVKTKLHQKVSL